MNNLETQAVLATVSRNLRALRSSRQLTLDSLATRAGVSKSMLIQIEQSRTNPSLAILCRIASTLGVSMQRLLDDSFSGQVRFVPKTAYVTLWKGEQGGEGRLLAGLDQPGLLELWDWRLCSGDSYKAEPQITGATAILHVLTGKLTIQVGHETHEVAKGETIVFSADTDHRYSNQKAATVRMIIAYNEPGTGRKRFNTTALKRE